MHRMHPMGQGGYVGAHSTVSSDKGKNRNSKGECLRKTFVVRLVELHERTSRIQHTFPVICLDFAKTRFLE